MKYEMNDNGERGAALIMALLMMALMLALTMGISMTAISELGVSNTYANQTQAFQAAEAGLYHATHLVRNYTGTGASTAGFTNLLAERTDYPTGNNNPFTDSTKFTSGCVMIDDDPDNPTRGHLLLSANLDGSGNQLPVPGVHYRVRMLDDEKTGSGAAITIRNFNPTFAWEDGNAASDTNNRVVVYSTGTYGSSSVTLEGWIGFVPYPALVAQRDVTVDGNANIEGAYGGVHSNQNLSVTASAHVEQTATAVGTFTQSNSTSVGGFHGGGQEPLYIPKFVTEPTATSSPHIQDYLVQKADVILLDPGFADGATRDFTGTATATLRLKKLADSLAIPSSQYTAFATAIDTNSSGNVDQSSSEAVSINRATNPISFTHATTDLSTYGWNYSGSRWSIPSNSTGADNHTFYVVGLDNYNTTAAVQSDGLHVPQNGGNVDIQGNAGSLAAPIRTTILATGSITISGNPFLEGRHSGLTVGSVTYPSPIQTPELPPFVRINPLLIAVEDLEINGDVGAGAGNIRFSGICYAGEQVYLSGNGEIQGQVLALNNPNVHGTTGSNGSPVDRNDNEVTGSFVLNFNGGQAVGKIKLMSWRQIKQ
ncbi:MAG TPA: PilX N-terminal domain-containing pilus assembly protein [Blastocatellia bacterium]|nr:PilX N-terminal domain-containing pilus assembly protein [Blastocatellia bacterium]